MPGTKDSVYSGQRASLLTRHGKQAVIGPELWQACGCEVVHTDEFDTDSLGTFTRDVARSGSQLEAARAKARMGMQLTGLPVGVASEGAVSADPFSGLLSWNYELVVLVDDTRRLELQGFHGAPARSLSATIGDWSEVLAFTESAGFPQHQLVLRPDDEHSTDIRKGISDLGQLRVEFDRAMRLSRTDHVFLEVDLRAHANPTRMETIREAARQLTRQMNSLCPGCGSPGYWPRERIRGLPCAACGSATRLPRAQVWSCLKCAHRQVEAIGGEPTADPARCDVCNP